MEALESALVADFLHPIRHALLQPGNVISRTGHPAVERHMLARMGRLLPDEGVDIGDKLGRRAAAKGADAVDEERLALWKNGRHRIVEGSCDRIAVQPPARLRLAPAEGAIALH